MTLSSLPKPFVHTTTSTRPLHAWVSPQTHSCIAAPYFSVTAMLAVAVQLVLRLGAAMEENQGRARASVTATARGGTGGWASSLLLLAGMASH